MDQTWYQRNCKIIIWLGLWPITLILITTPIASTILRLSIIASITGLLVGLLLLCWNKKIIRYFILLITVAIFIFLILPGNNIDPATLRQTYIESLSRYEGTKYIWGGENKFGIDCSGLIRCGLISANLEKGISTANPKLIREGLTLWWNDCSARELKAGYRNKLKYITTAQSIIELDHSILLPGDIAVTSNGIHTLAYIGDNTWIEADPNVMKVIKLKVPQDKNNWLNIPIEIMRWKQMEE